VAVSQDDVFWGGVLVVLALGVLMFWAAFLVESVGTTLIREWKKK